MRTALVLAAALVLAGCGGDPSPTERLSVAAETCDQLGVEWDPETPYLVMIKTQFALDCMIGELDVSALVHDHVNDTAMSGLSSEGLQWTWLPGPGVNVTVGVMSELDPDQTINPED